MRPPRTLALLALALLGCGASDAEPSLRVFAASSLTDAFDALERSFEASHPGADVSTSYAGSQILRLQIDEGAPADVFASADAAHVDDLVASGRVVEPRVFARNALVLIVPPDNPAGIASFEDLPRARRLVIGDESVPVGRYTRALLRAADERWGGRFEERALARVVSLESNVRLVRAKVAIGEADAAIVYRTDAVGADVRTLEVPAELAVRAEYHAGVVRGGRERAARGWLDYLESPAGRAVLEAHGFEVGGAEVGGAEGSR